MYKLLNRIKKFYLKPIAVNYCSPVFEFISQLFHGDSIVLNSKFYLHSAVLFTILKSNNFIWLQNKIISIKNEISFLFLCTNYLKESKSSTWGLLQSNIALQFLSLFHNCSMVTLFCRNCMQNYFFISSIFTILKSDDLIWLQNKIKSMKKKFVFYSCVQFTI